MISPEVRTEIRRLFYAEHWKVGTIAAQFEVHRDTVVLAINGQHFSWRGAVRPSGLDPYIEFMSTTLKQYPTLTGTRVWEMLRQRGYKGSVAQVRRRIASLNLRPTKRQTAYLRMTTVLGEQGEVDWGHFGRLRVGDIERPLYAFVVVLSRSGAFHVTFSHEQTMGAVLRGHVAAMEHFGGVPRRLLYDNMKTAVIERAGDAVRFNPRLLELAGHYHFAPIACRPRCPTEKPRVERRIRDLRTSFFAGRSFSDLPDIHRQFDQWRTAVAYARRCPSDISVSVADALLEERQLLLPLPLNPIHCEDTRTTVARKQPYVIWDTNRYSIPHTLVGIPLTITANHTRIRVLHGDEVVAEHPRSWGRRQVIELPVHIDELRKEKRRGRTLSGRSRLLDVIPEAEKLYVALAARGEPFGHNTATLLLLLDRYGVDILAEAIMAALERGTPGAASVQHLIAQRQKQLGTPPVLPVRLPDRPGVVELKTKNHKLEDYDDLG